jgi:tetratricopeptide (TPR) repeat protein
MPAASPRTDAEARAALDSELARLAPRRAQLGETGVHAVCGWTLEHAMEWEAAALAWGRAFELDPRDPTALFHRGQCLLEMSDWAAAADVFRQAIALDAEVSRLDWFDEDPEYRLGNALHAAGDLDGALAAYERSAAKNVVGVDSLREAARIQIVRNRPREALDVLKRFERRAVRLTVRAEAQALRAEAEALLRGAR